MMLTGEFYMLETTHSDSYVSWKIFSADQPGDPRANFREEADFNKKVRLLRCRVEEVMEEQS